MSELTPPSDGAAPNPAPPQGPRKPLSTTTWVVLGLVALFIIVAAFIKLTEGPSTKAEVCASFDELGDRAIHANGFIDNPVFSQADDLADLAARFEGPPDLSSDADALSRIADADSTNLFELMRATQQIARLCGHGLR